MDRLHIDVWYDVVCPWCWLGKARLDAALAGRSDVEVRTHAFELDRKQPPELDVATSDFIAKKLGMPREKLDGLHQKLVAMGQEVGIDYHFDRTRTANTFEAHQLVHVARNAGGEAAANDMVERLFRANFRDGLRVGSRDVLLALARDAGIADAAEALEAQTYAAAVRDDEAKAHAMGVGGVPFFLFEGRLAVEGAQSVAVLREALARAADTARG